MSQVVTIVAMLVLLISVEATAGSVSVEVVPAAIDAQNVKYEQAVREQDVPTFLSLYTDDATVILVGDTIKSREAREKTARAQVTAIANVELETREVESGTISPMRSASTRLLRVMEEPRSRVPTS